MHLKRWRKTYYLGIPWLFLGARRTVLTRDSTTKTPLSERAGRASSRRGRYSSSFSSVVSSNTRLRRDGKAACVRMRSTAGSSSTSMRGQGDIEGLRRKIGTLTSWRLGGACARIFARARAETWPKSGPFAGPHSIEMLSAVRRGQHSSFRPSRADPAKSKISVLTYCGREGSKNDGVPVHPWYVPML